ncbi:hypothetical protein V7S43_013365 [Phytophthora oleae]|uniref:RxLR effector protein n=1 Tax=Phytophthora oleae TaxID=2107226 RepID=A0ABD3F5G5_9STRA
MRLLLHVLVIVCTLVAVIDGLPTNDQVNPSFPVDVSSPDAASSVRGRPDKTNDKHLRSGEEDEERGLLTKAKLELWLKLGYSPSKAYKKLHLPRNIDDAYNLKNWKQMKEFYTMWLNKMAARKAPTIS